ncbi:unnamed protein product [Pylaiella littoralis]
MGDVVCCRLNTRQNSANSKHAASTPSCFLPPLELLPSTPLLMQHPRRHLINYFLLHLAPSTAFLPGPSRCLTLLRGRIALSAVVPPDSGRQYCSTSSSRATEAAHPCLPRTRSRSTPPRLVGSDGTAARTRLWGSGGYGGSKDVEEESWGNWNADSSGGEKYADEAAGNPWEDSSQNKWEALYAEGEKEKQGSTFLSAMADWGKGGVLGEIDVEFTMPVEVVSFDLDDTLWSTMAVINQANEALQEHLSREHPALAEQCVIADFMKEVWKEKVCLCLDPTLDPAPVNLTELRKAGLARACEVTGTDPSTVVESCFDVWRRARHDVEPHLFPGVLETLKALRDRGVRLVAITNGNAQTDDIPCLKDLFEFCVMAEQVGERKPDPGPFQEAVRRAGYPSSNSVGGEWVHVGDDWASDCVGAKKMRMRSVLVRVPGKPAVGSAPDEEEEEEEEREEGQDGSLDGVAFNDDADDDDKLPTLDDLSIPDQSPEGKAQRLRQEQERARKRAEKLGILIDSDFEIAAGTAASNIGRKSPDENNSQAPTAPSAAAAAAATQTTAKDRKRLQKEEEEEEEEGERRARAELKDQKQYGQEMAAIAMGHPEAAKGEGKVMSMGSSTYVMDRLMKDFMDVSLDNITEVVGLVDEWSKIISSTGHSGSGSGSGSGGGVRSRSNGGKFCTECGVKIPAAAKFCSDCGTKQEVIA